jgi:pyruvate formate lyase activating enzyme
VDEVMRKVEKDTLFYEESGGGVTLSGGEPLAQPGFCRALLQRCRSLGIKTALDTSGYAPKETLLTIAKFVDLFLYDLKSMDEERHRIYTGVSNTEILRNLKRLDQLGKQIWIRFPLIPGINDDLDHVTQLGEFVTALSSVEAIHVLPYHRGGEAKRGRLGWTDNPSPLTPPTGKMTDAVLARLREIVRVPVRLGG